MDPRPAKTKERHGGRAAREFFICHAAGDAEFAEILALRLEREGYSVWIGSQALQPGKDWRVEIDEGIRRSCALIVVMSPEAGESPYVGYEWAFALGSGAKVIPLILKPTPLHPRLETLQCLDFSNRTARPWAQLFAALASTAVVSRHGPA
jgi:hypothetical protein